MPSGWMCRGRERKGKKRQKMWSRRGCDGLEEGATGVSVCACVSVRMCTIAVHCPLQITSRHRATSAVGATNHTYPLVASNGIVFACLQGQLTFPCGDSDARVAAGCMPFYSNDCVLLQCPGSFIAITTPPTAGHS